MNRTLVSASTQSLRPQAPVGRAWLGRHGLVPLRGMVARWRERTRYRWDLKRMSEISPHLIDDIGLTARQVEEEIAKLPFWQR